GGPRRGGWGVARGRSRGDRSHALSRRQTWNAAAHAAVGLLLLFGCGKDHGTDSTRNAPLFEFNASQNNGRTIRWPVLPVRVFLGNGIAQPGEVSVWTAETSGAVTFVFVPGAGTANITFGYRSGTDVCGVTVIAFTDNGNI